MRRRVHPAWLLTPVGLLVITMISVAHLQRYTKRSPDPAAWPEKSSGTARPDANVPSPTDASDLWNIPPVRNVSADISSATYVGRETCRECHQEQWESYSKTHHSQAMEEIDLPREPPDGQFFHEKSRRLFISRRDSEHLVHSEILLSAQGETVLEQSFAVRWAIGSGHHSRSYLVEREEFLFESPLTWYAARNGWWVSPGYDNPVHDSFERPVDAGCVHCHAGRVETLSGNRYRFDIRETAIGCESCHGPGSAHVQLQKASSASGEQFIVNPARLGRELQESICALCHLRGVASVLVRGRTVEEFRPGMYLADFRVNYTTTEQGQMSVVGHVEQMRQSACWQKSLLTCTTCHDPHRPVPVEERTAYYRKVCVECHAPPSCGIAEAERTKTVPEDSCIVCHMPQSPTDIPHFAFTHHRIGLHDTQHHRTGSDGAAQARTIPELIPLDDISHLPSREQRRCLGLGYVEAGDRATDPMRRAAYWRRALELLEPLVEHGLDDPDVWAALARIYWQTGRWDQAVAAAQRVQGRDTPSGALVNALLVLGDVLESSGHYAEAEQAAQLLLQRRRFSGDLLLLASSQARQNRWDDAVRTMERAVALHPFRRNSRALYAAILLAAGRPGEAKIQRELAELVP
ncbi:MAG: hypothetical protein KatS3mg110_1887 [Pirellulaceae bacterium]|nr:MAG: hypothetical protein KatS3mg110_1887 [Pirellulaceae bacterium]